jgi:transposase
LSERPHRVRSWAPVGQTPVLEFNFNWQKLSAIAGLSSRSFCFRIHAGTIRTPQVIAFLGQLRRHFRGKLLIIWDRAQIHRSLRVRRHIEKHQKRITVAYLPAYAPELNPVEYLWGYWKERELANFCPKDIWELGHFASQALKRIRRRPNRRQIIAAFWKQADLF